MPKLRTSKVVNGKRVEVKAPSKFRIGSRKGGQSALLMTVDELIKVVRDEDKSKYHENAKTVLRNKHFLSNMAIDCYEALLK